MPFLTKSIKSLSKKIIRNNQTHHNATATSSSFASRRKRSSIDYEAIANIRRRSSMHAIISSSFLLHDDGISVIRRKSSLYAHTTTSSSLSSNDTFGIESCDGTRKSRRISTIQQQQPLFLLPQNIQKTNIDDRKSTASTLMQKMSLVVAILVATQHH